MLSNFPKSFLSRRSRIDIRGGIPVQRVSDEFRDDRSSGGGDRVECTLQELQGNKSRGCSGWIIPDPPRREIRAPISPPHTSHNDVLHHRIVYTRTYHNEMLLPTPCANPPRAVCDIFNIRRISRKIFRQNISLIKLLKALEAGSVCVCSSDIAQSVRPLFA